MTTDDALAWATESNGGANNPYIATLAAAVRQLEAENAALRADCAQFCGDLERLIKATGAETVDGALKQIAALRQERDVLESPALNYNRTLARAEKAEADLARARAVLDDATPTNRADLYMDDVVVISVDLAAWKAWQAKDK